MACTLPPEAFNSAPDEVDIDLETILAYRAFLSGFFDPLFVDVYIGLG